ncbi:MAG: ABC transporter permease [Candidatus Cloacimonadota bacterium]|nr:ABC transporter permease [Candidatus Cloacimonadota bacterium]
MNIAYNIKLGVSDMIHNIGRTIITMIGVILGALTIIVVSSLVQGGREKSLQFMEERGGALKLSIHPQWSFDLNKRSEAYQQRLTLEDMKKLRRYFPELQAFSPTISKWNRLKFEGKYTHARTLGVYPEYQEAEEFYIGEGRFISNFDIREAKKVIVIGTLIKERLFGEKPAIGKKINLNGTKFHIIGIMEKKEMYFGAMGENALSWMNRRCFVPLTTMTKKMYYDEPLSSINFRVSSVDKVTPTQQKISQFLLALRDGNQVFEVRANNDRMEDIKKQTQKTLFVVIIIFIFNLLVSGIVIANISLASIKERLREIGVRMAVGAKRRDILIQFLVQTLLVSLLGGIVGILLGLSLLSVLGNFLKSPTATNLAMIEIALGLSVGVGFISGIVPAINASRLDPVEILRYE